MTFSRYGFTKARQTVSHVIMVKQGLDVTISVPLHDPMKWGTLRKLISDAGLSVEEFCELLKTLILFLIFQVLSIEGDTSMGISPSVLPISKWSFLVRKSTALAGTRTVSFPSELVNL